MARIIVLSLLVILFSCGSESDKHDKYGIDYNETRKSYNIDTLPGDWIPEKSLFKNEFSWKNPDTEKYLTEGMSFYGRKRISINEKEIVETNYYYSGKKGNADYGDVKHLEPQYIDQTVRYSRINQTSPKISYSFHAYDSISCHEFWTKLDSAARLFRDHKYWFPCTKDEVRHLGNQDSIPVPLK